MYKNLCISSDCGLRKRPRLRNHIFPIRPLRNTVFVQHAVITPPNPCIGRGITAYERLLVSYNNKPQHVAAFLFLIQLIKGCLNRYIVSLSMPDSTGCHIHMQRLITDLY